MVLASLTAHGLAGCQDLGSRLVELLEICAFCDMMDSLRGLLGDRGVLRVIESVRSSQSGVEELGGRGVCSGNRPLHSVSSKF